MTRPQSAAIVAREMPILFGAPMIRAIQVGTKTQTRRILKPQPGDLDAVFMMDDGTWHVTGSDGSHMSALGIRWRVGDRLWVREAWSPEHKWTSTKPRDIPNGDDIWYWADGNPPDGDWTKPKPSIHMPRWASRITLEVVAVRVERLQAISEVDALAEGIEGTEFWRDQHPPSICYSVLWNHINGATSWDANPWVSVTEFQRVTP